MPKDHMSLKVIPITVDVSNEKHKTPVAYLNLSFGSGFRKKNHNNKPRLNIEIDLITIAFCFFL